MNRNDIIVRKCKYEDLDKVIDIEEISFLNPYPYEIFYDFLGSELFLVAKKDEVVGYVIVDLKGDKAVLLSIAVLPEHRREGIGTALIEETLKRVEKDIIVLTLRINNKDAYQFYRTLGFTYSGIIEDYYENGEDGVLMKKIIEVH
ncbi:MAG: GNAT family N-acetyltransferase [Thermoplasmatota archaeon]